MENQRPPRRGLLSLQRDVTVSDVIAIVAVVFSIIWWAHNAELKQAVVSERVESQSATDHAQDRATAAGFARVETRLGRIEDKVDRLVEWQMRSYSLRGDRNGN